MRIVIDIPKFVYDMTKAQKKVIDADAEIVGKAIIEGTVLPNDATNGDILRLICPMWIEYHDTDVEVTINKKIWNAPYNPDKEGDTDGTEIHN